MVNIQADTDEASESDMETSNDKDIETIVKVSKIWAAHGEYWRVPDHIQKFIH